MSPPQVAFPIRFTRHAVERYNERFRPALDLAHTSRELAAVAAHGQLTAKVPAGVAAQNDTVLYLIVGDAVFPLIPGGRGLRAITCLVRGQLTPKARGFRRKARRHIRGPAQDRSGGQ